MLIKKANWVAAMTLMESPIQSAKLADITKEPMADKKINIIEPIYRLEI
jgi:hypothetical protein